MFHPLKYFVFNVCIAFFFKRHGKSQHQEAVNKKCLSNPIHNAAKYIILLYSKRLIIEDTDKASITYIFW